MAGASTPSEHSALSKKYDLRLITVISSTKIRNRVTTILNLLSLSEPASVTSRATGSGEALKNKSEKPSISNDGASQSQQHTIASNHGQAQSARKADGCTQIVVAISAKAAVASKLISIVEIVKREVQVRKVAESASEQAKPTRRKSASLFQYSMLTGTIQEQKSLDRVKVHEPAQSKKRKHVGDEDQSTLASREGSTSAKRQKIGVLNRNNDTIKSNVDGAQSTQRQVADCLNDQENEKDDYFEVLDEARVRAAIIDDIEKKPPRPTPFLTIYLSRKPLDQLEEFYGEQFV